MREELQYTPGHWWHRKGTNECFRNAFLGEWDSRDNYELITDAEKEQYDDEELTDAEALQIITSHEEE